MSSFPMCWGVEIAGVCIPSWALEVATAAVAVTLFIAWRRYAWCVCSLLGHDYELVDSPSIEKADELAAAGEQAYRNYRATLPTRSLCQRCGKEREHDWPAEWKPIEEPEGPL